MQARRGFILALIMMVLISACSSGESEPSPTPEPTLTPVPTSTSTNTPAPTNTGEPTALPTATATLVSIELSPSEGQPPPFTIDLPEGWSSAYYALPIEEIDGNIRVIQIAGYNGPVTEGAGYVIVIWGFSNISVGNPLTGGTQSLWLDGLRFWRLQVVEPDCNVGTDLQREFTVGGLPAVGTFVSAVDCPDTPDTAGWFAGLNNEGANFIFYAFTEPSSALQNETGAPAELQNILDSVQFFVADRMTQVALTPSPEAEATEAP
ncbi:MAG: hypothetical protein RLP44_04920 [Aggregatilineales bacterium]